MRKSMWTPTFLGPGGDQTDQRQQEQRESGGLHNYRRERSTPQRPRSGAEQNGGRKEKQDYALQGPIGGNRGSASRSVARTVSGTVARWWIVEEAPLKGRSAH